MKRWYCLVTRPNQELKAQAQLEFRNYEVYLPMAFADKRTGKRNYKELRPLFPRYLFVFMGKMDSWYTITNTPGVAGIIKLNMDGGGYLCPTPINTTIIDALKAHEDAEGIHMTYYGYKPKDPIRVKSGPFEDFLGNILSLKSEDRVIALLTIMNRQVPVEFGYHEVVPV